MASTQSDIARAVGLDISSVNKILNRRRGMTFRKDTVAKVFSTAKKMKYELPARSKSRIVQVLRDLFPEHVDVDALAFVRGVEREKVLEIRALVKDL